jgi:hypothetical protein
MLREQVPAIGSCMLTCMDRQPPVNLSIKHQDETAVTVPLCSAPLALRELIPVPEPAAAQLNMAVLRWRCRMVECTLSPQRGTMCRHRLCWSS